jgi:hypothetical protein
MNTMEGRIRAAAHAAANTVPPDGVPPLQLPGQVVPVRRRGGWAVLAGRGPAGRGLAGWVAGGGQWARWVAPVAAAVAVVVVLVAASVIAGRGMAGAPAAGRGSTAGSTSVAELVKSGQIPPYYLDVTGNPDGINGPTYVVVRATATGKALGTIRPSVPGDGIMGVTGAADDRTFILDEQPLAKGDRDVGREPHTFYEVRLDAAGKPGPATKLPLSLPRYRLLEAFSLSPDGSRLAMAVEPLPDPGTLAGSATVTVYTLATGQSHSWTGNGQVSLAQDDPQALSWTSDGQTLAFQWNANSTDAAASGFRVLHLAQGGDNLEADSHEVVPFFVNGNRLGCIEAGVAMTADGSALTCSGGRVVNPNAAPGRQQSQSGLTEFSTATGKLLRVLGGWHDSAVAPMGVCWSNASGSLVIGIKDARDIAARALMELGVQSAAGFTPLPGKPPQNGPMALAW